MRTIAVFGFLSAMILGLSACDAFSSKPGSSPAPQQSGYYDNQLHGGYPGPGTTANRE